MKNNGRTQSSGQLVNVFLFLGLSMRSLRFYCCCLAACFVIASAASDKQIKLEDIEKDTLKAAQQTKYEKQIQQQQQQQQQYQQAYQYDPQVYAQQNIAYQTPASSYSQYLIPQQYIPQPVLSGYAPLAGNSLGTGYAAPSANAFQTYLSPQLTIPSVSSFHGSQPIAAATQTQPIIMAFTAPALSAFQHQPYYQGGFQYYPTQSAQASPFYYAPQSAGQTSSSQVSSNVVYPSAQQYVTSFQPATAAKASTSFSQQYISTAPQTFPAQSFVAQPEYTSIYSPQTYTSNSIYSNTETPTFVTVKAPQHLVASQGQQQQYVQAHPTTISPLQAKYLNSPQYLAQNYNTIQSSQLYSKGILSSGVKSTASPPLKTPSGGQFGSNNFASASSSSSSYLPFRSLPPKNF